MRRAVLEVGTNHPGELAPLVAMIQPQFGVITNIGREHLEFFGDLDGVVDEEGWLAELLPATGKLFRQRRHEWREKSPGVVEGGLRIGLATRTTGAAATPGQIKGRRVSGH